MDVRGPPQFHDLFRLCVCAYRGMVEEYPTFVTMHISLVRARRRLVMSSVVARRNIIVKRDTRTKMLCAVWGVAVRYITQNTYYRAKTKIWQRSRVPYSDTSCTRDTDSHMDGWTRTWGCHMHIRYQCRGAIDGVRVGARAHGAALKRSSSKGPDLVEELLHPR